MDEDHVEAMRSMAEHIRRVQALMGEAMWRLHRRAVEHDVSKWGDSEWPYFAEATKQLSKVMYGSPDYQRGMEAIKPAIRHHHETNSHHPEFYKNGLCDMTLLDLVEMLADWKASGERHPDGSLVKSLRVNATRFDIPPVLLKILEATARELHWLD